VSTERTPVDALADWKHFWSGIEADMRITLGIDLVAADEREVIMKMPYKPEISQATGLFSAGSLIQLADVASTWLCSLRLRESGARDDAFPFAVQLSSNLVANTDHGDAVARATLVSAGRTVIVTRTEVHDEEQRIMLVQTGTHVVKVARQTK
jgi:uncharacterized protein (TIGR00369 family)